MSDFFYGEQANLFTSRRFEDVSVEVKVLYGFLLDRMGLSAKNGWKDEEGRVYIIFTVESIMEKTNVAEAAAASCRTASEASVPKAVRAAASRNMPR